MEPTERLSFIPHNEMTHATIAELWNNCFDGPENDAHVNCNVPTVYRAPGLPQLANFFLNGMNHTRSRAWLVKRESEEDIIGYLIHGNFVQPNSIGFVIGLPYIHQGYAREAVGALLNHIEFTGFTETNAYTLEANAGAIRLLKQLGFSSPNRTGITFVISNIMQYEVKLTKTF